MVEIDIELSKQSYDSRSRIVSKTRPSLTDSKETSYGWVIVMMSFFATFLVFGFMYSSGVLLTYYRVSGFGEPTELSFIATTNAAVGGIGSVFAGRVDSKLKHQRCILLGTVTYATGMLLSSWATNTWQLLLTQGLMMGVGISLVFMATLTAVMQWFDKRRGLACGLTLAGSGIGGLVIAPTLQFLIPMLGIAWSLRIFALVALVVLSLVGLVVREPSHVKTQTSEPFNFKLLLDRKLILLLVSVATFALGFLVPLFTMQSYAIHHGIDPVNAALIVGVMNGCSALGRVVTGFLADHLGNVNMAIITMFLTGLSCALVWSFAHSFTSLILFGVIYGIVSGGFVSLPAVVSVQLFGIANASQVTSFIFVAMGLPNLVGTPIANYILTYFSTMENINYLPLILYSGFTALLGSLFLIFLKLSVPPHNLFTIL